MRSLASPLSLIPLAAMALFLLLPAAASAAGPVEAGSPPPGRAIVGAHPMCDAELLVTDNARFSTGFAPEPTWPFQMTAGLWVGAIADRGSGPETLVSTGMFSIEFFSPDNPPPPRPSVPELFVDGFQAVSRDTYTPGFLPEHRPLGLEVTQDSHVVQTFGDRSWVDVKYTITNISPELGGSGWDLHDVYLGILADPDVGVGGNDLMSWEDDWGAFAPGARWPGDGVSPGAERGDLAYMWDGPGNDDDTDVQVGVVLRNRRAHRFAIWRAAADDPQNDLERYELMRGLSDDSPTIDPPADRAADHRILIAASPHALLAPGESIGFEISFVCGDLVPLASPPGRVAVDRAPDLVVPRGAAGVRLATDRPVEVFSVAGRRVATTRAGESWDLRVAGRPASAGVYFYRPVDRSAPVARIVVLR